MQCGANGAGVGPAWTRGEIEAPAGEKNMGSWTAAVYTPEQQARLKVTEMGEKLNDEGQVMPGRGLTFSIGGGGGGGGGGSGDAPRPAPASAPSPSSAPSVAKPI